MSKSDREQDDEVDGVVREAEDGEEYEDEPRNPFDNPYFLPVLLAGFALWCGWDGFVSDKFADRPSTLLFNRVMFLLLGAISAWMTLRARREVRAGKGEGV
jgi:hypothetical protein